MRWVVIALALVVAGCSGETQRCWGTPNGVNYCTTFVQQHFWTGAVAITDARYTQGISVSNQLATSTGVASTLGGEVFGEVASHVAIAP
jgi:hypothetical protein